MMEKKKLLLVSVSVGVFLVIVIGASILVFSPRNSSPAAVVNTVNPIPAGNPGQTGNSLPGTPPGSVGAVELVKNSLALQGLTTAADDNPQDNILYIYGENPDDAVTVDRTSSSGGNRLVVDVRRPTTAAVPETPAPKVAPKPAAAPARQSPAPAPKAAAPKTAAPKTPASSAAGSSPDNFWIQTGSFSTIARAEAARDTLASKSITALIENRTVGGKNFFRVRVGPYTSQNEADYWQKLIKEFNGFEGSIVLRSPAQ
jgi:DedD protein